ncbi:hypothetical protein J7E63_15940 [Bacillus sp. ISL-75]|uniref:hypothetical protein n=1 Tax=Bacillus sp. ISL-75 TaxID=2819137 RepID=UPI001BE936CE|nr:hypothetical protein [Bacillus sp. ISL-75]MBT2728420.1 hypothetical protein [Bacillus sp. ISL-75]
MTKPYVKTGFYFCFRMEGGFLINIKKTVFKLIILLIVLTLISNDIREVKASSISLEKGELSLKQAINLGIDRAKKWNDKASLINVNSVDETRGGSRGKTGKRYNWFLNYMVPGTEDYLLLGISKGKITVFEQLKQSGQEQTIAYSAIKFDSSDLVRIAKDKYGLNPGKDWATGYHFTLRMIEDTPTISVLGTDKDKLFTRITFDAKNGKITGAIHKVPYGGGLLSLQPGSNRSKITKKSMAIMGITAGKEYLVTWGDRKPTQFSTTNHPFLEVCSNSGKRWSELDLNKYVKHAWFNANDELYVLTASEIWSNVTHKSKGTKILTLKKEIENIDYSFNNNIAVLSDGMVYSTINQGDSWEKHPVPESLHTVQISDKGELFVLTQSRKILRKNSDKWKPISIPSIAGVPWDMKILKNKIVISTDLGLWKRDVSGVKWEKRQVDEPIARLIKKGHNLFGITDRGSAIYRMDLGNETIDKIDKVYEAKDIIVWDIDVFQNILLIATIPDYSWEEMDTRLSN